MKHILFITVFLLNSAFFLNAVNTLGPEEEKASIKQAALDYIEGWYEGNFKRMDKALHTDLIKRGVQIIPDTGKTIFAIATKTNMVEYTRAGKGKNPEKKQKCEVIILDLFKNTASVKTVSPDYVDYLHLVKADGEWKIINVLWEMNK